MTKAEAKCPSQAREGWTAMHLAAHYGRDKIMAHLLAQRPHWVDEVTLKQRNPLHIAAKRGHSNIVAQLLDATTNNEDLLKQDLNKNNALHLAINHGQLGVVSRLIMHDNTLAESTTSTGLTVLHLAARLGSLKLVEALIRRFPQLVGRVDDFGKTPLHYAAESGHVDLLYCLLGKMGTVVCKGGWTPLHLAAEGGHTSVVNYLVYNMPSLVEARSDSGKTALHLAAGNSLRAVADRLVRDSPELLVAVDNHGRTALHFAVRDGQEEMTRDLLNWRPSLIDVADSKGKTVLYEALKNKHILIVELLLNYNPTVIDANMLRLALKEEGLVQALLASKPELVYDVDSDGNTVLHRAAAVLIPHYIEIAGSITRIVGLFPDAARAVNKQNQTPLHVAISASNHLAIPQLQWQLSLDEITEAFATCGKKPPLANLRPLVERHCEDWEQEVLEVVFDYLGFNDQKKPKQSRPKRKREQEAQEEQEGEGGEGEAKKE